nr:uroporphyrinogen decarboxylase [Bacilli bacterium]
MMNDLFLRACRKETVERTPVWYMRQAGRYQPEYRKIREKYSLLEICERPDVCAQVTTLPITQLGVDAAILFSDIMVPVGAMGLDFDLKKDVGPMIDRPITSLADVNALHPIDPLHDLPYVFETIGQLKETLSVPLIGFSGAPFTLASYMIEGKPSRQYLKTKAMMYGEPAIWFALMDKLADMIVTYLEAQVKAGASALQIFDSWVGSLSPFDYEQYVLPVMQKIFERVNQLGVPTIYFGVGTGSLLSLFQKTGASVIGIDWRLDLATASQVLGKEQVLQGNLDPAVLLAPFEEIEIRASRIIEQGKEIAGHVFNLGHGVFPEVNVATLAKLTEYIHRNSER